MNLPTKQARILRALGTEELPLAEIAARMRAPGDDSPPRVSFKQTVQRMERAGLIVSRRETLPRVVGKQGIVTRKLIRKAKP